MHKAVPWIIGASMCVVAVLIMLWQGNPPAAPVVPPPKVEGTIFNLDVDVAPILSGFPGVKTVEVVSAKGPVKRRLIHLLDNVPKGLPRIDAQGLVVEAFIEAALANMEAVQADQLETLGALVHKHGLQCVLLEGVTEKDADWAGSAAEFWTTLPPP